MEWKKDGFAINQNKGFKLTHNGITISVQFGPSNYCFKQDIEDFFAPMKNLMWESPDAEIAIWDSEGNWITAEVVKRVLKEDCYDQVMGHITPAQVAKLISWMWTRETK
jgi:hypothetical protein